MVKSALQVHTVELKVISVSLGNYIPWGLAQGEKEDIKSWKLIQTLWTGPEMETDYQ